MTAFLVDLDMPGLGGIDVIAKAKELSPGYRRGGADRQVVDRNGHRGFAPRGVRLSDQAVQAGRDRSAAPPRAGKAGADATSIGR